MNNESFFKESFEIYANLYSHILSRIYPAKGSTGFPERNLSVNFSKAYEEVARKKKQDVTSWFEFQFGETNRNHTDLVMINTTSKELILVEAKRFSNPNKKMQEIGEDIERIYSLKKELIEDNSRIDMNRINHIYAIILADLWLENDLKINIYHSYQNKSFLKDYADKVSNIRNLNECYYCQDVNGKEKWLESYKLVSFIWEVI